MKPHLQFDLDALPKSDTAARSVGLGEGVAARALLSLWEYAWREQREWVTAQVLLGCCFGHERLPGALRALGFIEPVSAGWTSEITRTPIPEDGFRVCGAKKYLRIHAGQSKGGHAAKSNLIPGARYKVLSAASRLPLGSSRESVSADSGPYSDQRSAIIEESKTTADAGEQSLAVHPVGQEDCRTIAPAEKVAPGPNLALQEQVPGQVDLVPAPTVEDLRDAWNSHTELPRWIARKGAPGARARRAAAAIKAWGMDGPQGLRAALDRVCKSDFCLGRVPGRDGMEPFRASPEWFFRSVEKIFEGLYDNRDSRSQPDASREQERHIDTAELARRHPDEPEWARWIGVLDKLKQSGMRYAAQMLSRLEPVSEDGAMLVVTGERYIAEWCDSHYADALAEHDVQIRAEAPQEEEAGVEAF